MAKYIDANALGIGKADRKVFEKTEYADGWNSAIEIIANAPSADVVPRSEVDKWKANCEQLYKEMSERIMEERKIERKLAKKEVAREIFDVLDKKKRYLMKSNNYNLFKASIDFFDHIDDFVGLTGEEILAELEKKHIGDTTDGGVSSEYNFETGF